MCSKILLFILIIYSEYTGAKMISIYSDKFNEPRAKGYVVLLMSSSASSSIGASETSAYRMVLRNNAKKSIGVCEDCILLQSCPDAVKYSIKVKNFTKNSINSEEEKKLKAAVCGTEKVNGKVKPKVCCSDFVDLTVISETQPNDESDINLEEHANFGLLPSDCGPINGDRIHGGEYADLYEFPWMALILYVTETYRGKNKYEFKCGGSVINNKYILTAAHCVKDRRVTGVRIGEYDIRKRTDCQGEYPYRFCESHIQDFLVEKKIVHPGYKPLPFVENDIALLLIKNEINFSFRNARPICLPISKSLSNITLDGNIGTVAGWGVTETRQGAKILKKVDLRILRNSDCEDYYTRNPDSNANSRLDKKFCAGEEGTDSCRGDSGGPMMLEEEVNGVYRTVQYGIVCFGLKQCGTSTPGVYTDVRKYSNWILDNIAP